MCRVCTQEGGKSWCLRCKYDMKSESGHTVKTSQSPAAMLSGSGCGWWGDTEPRHLFMIPEHQVPTHCLPVRLVSALTLGEPMGNYTTKSCRSRVFFFFFLPPCETCGILAPQPSTEPGSLAVKAWSPNH